MQMELRCYKVSRPFQAKKSQEVKIGTAGFDPAYRLNNHGYPDTP